MKRAFDKARGLDAFFQQTSEEVNKTLSSAEHGADNIDESDVRMLKISLVEPRKDQPRKNFDREQLQQLAASIAEHGVIQPIIVVEGKNGYYSIIAGERRWRASKLANLTEIPAIVRKYSESEIAEVSLIENLQREDLNPIEEALGYKTLMDRFNMTQDKVSEKVGKSRSNIANMLRLLSLEDEIKDMLAHEELSMGQARALLAIEKGPRRVELAKKIADEDLNVREVEKLVKTGDMPKKEKHKAEKASVYPDVERNLSQKFGTKVKIKGNKKGKIEIEYYSVDELTRIVDLLQ